MKANFNATLFPTDRINFNIFSVFLSSKFVSIKFQLSIDKTEKIKLQSTPTSVTNLKQSFVVFTLAEHYTTVD